MSGSQWSKEEMDVLKIMCEADKKIEQISLVLKDRSIDAIRSKASKAGFELGGKPQINKEAFKQIMGGKR